MQTNIHLLPAGRFRTPICSASLHVLELYYLASRGQYTSATGQKNRMIKAKPEKMLIFAQMRVA